MRIHLPKIPEVIMRTRAMLDSFQTANIASQRVSLWLAAGVMLAPFVFSPFVLKRRFHPVDRALSAAWTIFYIVIVGAWMSDRSTNKVVLAPDPRAIILPEKQVPLSGASPNSANLPSVLVKAAHFDKCGILYLALAERSTRSGDNPAYKAHLQYSQNFRDIAVNILRTTGISNEAAQLYLRDEVESDPELARDVAKVISNKNDSNFAFAPLMAGCFKILREAGGDPALAKALERSNIDKPNQDRNRR